MNVTKASKIMIEGTIHVHNRALKNYPAELGAWWGDNKCDEIDLNAQVLRVTSDGEYKITITLEKI